MPQLVRAPTKVTGSAFSVAHESADDAILAAEAVALLERRVLRQPELGSSGVTERAAGILTIDRQCRAVALHGGNDGAAFARTLIQSGCACRVVARVIDGKTVGAAGTDRKRTSRWRGRRGDKQKGPREHKPRKGPIQFQHPSPPPRNRIRLPRKPFHLVNGLRPAAASERLAGNSGISRRR